MELTVNARKCKVPARAKHSTDLIGVPARRRYAVNVLNWPPMKSFALLLALLLGALSTPPATAGEPSVWRYNRHSTEPPFPLSERAESIWASGACWSECGSYTAWNLVACLEREPQGRCLKHADAADRACQRTCRTRGGPLLPIDTLFPLAY
jgi:hypothetical protein